MHAIFILWAVYNKLTYDIRISITALNRFNVERRDVESSIASLKSELKNEIGNENLDALDSLGDDLLFELNNQSVFQKKRSSE